MRWACILIHGQPGTGIFGNQQFNVIMNGLLSLASEYRAYLRNRSIRILP